MKASSRLGLPVVRANSAISNTYQSQVYHLPLSRLDMQLM